MDNVLYVKPMVRNEEQKTIFWIAAVLDTIMRQRVTCNSTCTYRHVLGVRPNILQTLRGQQFWTLKIPIRFRFVTHCSADKRTRNSATRCVLRARCSEIRLRPRTPLGELTVTVLPRPLAGFKGEKGKKRKGRGKEWGRVAVERKGEVGTGPPIG